MPPIPKTARPDSTLDLARDPYRFVLRVCARLDTDVFQTRLMLRPTVFMKGPAAAELFYDPERFVRGGAAPLRVQRTLFGRGGVQGLDGEAHRHRKAMLMSLMTPTQIERLLDATGEQWRKRSRTWMAADRVVLYDEVREILTRAVCTWTGVPLPEPKVHRRTRELTALFDYAGAIGPKHWWSRLARQRADGWIKGVIEQVRAGRIDPPPESALHVIALHRQPDGNLLDPHSAAVELLNVLRPTVAVAVFITFVAAALHQFPAYRRRLAAGDGILAEHFVQEVRRFYPFFPAVLARVRQDFQWNGYRFPRGRRVILDLYGTNQDRRSWAAPQEFRPERFRDWDGNPFDFIPQGGGDHLRDHRCAGEWITIALMKQAVMVLTGQISYRVAEQDLEIDWSRLPALPRSRFVMTDVRC